MFRRLSPFQSTVDFEKEGGAQEAGAKARADHAAVLKEQKEFQSVLKNWKLCDDMVCLLTMSGLFITYIYHFVAVQRLANFCFMNSDEDCKEHLQNGRLKKVSAKYWDGIVIMLNFGSLLFFIWGQHYSNVWFAIFQRRDTNKQKVKGFTKKDRAKGFIL